MRSSGLWMLHNVKQRSQAGITWCVVCCVVINVLQEPVAPSYYLEDRGSRSVWNINVPAYQTMWFHIPVTEQNTTE